jgi:hypothetical protein
VFFVSEHNPVDAYRVIEAEKASYPIKRTCALLEVSRSGYQKWRANRDGGPTLAQRRRAELDAKVAKFHTASDGVYGAPRILVDLRAGGAVEAKYPKPRYIVGASGKASVLARLLLTDRMWDRIMMKDLKA